MGNHGAGMSRNPFGGRDRLDKCNLQGPSLHSGKLVDVASNTPGERTLIAETFRDAIFHYLFWGLGRNGTSAEEFYWASVFLLHARASKPETWQHARIMRETFRDDSGKRVKRVIVLSDAELKAMCADHMWQLGRWGGRHDFEMFVRKLKAKRREILEDNRAQVLAYIETLKSRTLRRIKPGENLSFTFASQDIFDVLVDPVDPDDLSEIIGYQPRRARCSTRSTRPRRRLSHGPRHRATPSPMEGDSFVFEIGCAGPARVCGHGDCGSAH